MQALRIIHTQTTDTRIKFQEKKKKKDVLLKSDSSVGKKSACNAGDPSSIPGSEDPLEKG